MKMDIDTIVVIIVSLLFIILSGLTRRRKKKPDVKSNLQYKQTSGQWFKSKDLLNDTASMISNPFDRLEKMFNIPEQTDSQEGESLEVITEKEPEFTEAGPVKMTSSIEVPVENESQSLEVIVDEVAEYLKEKDISRSTVKPGKQYDEMDLNLQEKRAGGKLEQKQKTKIQLFANVDDIKKAVIYSEILNRKEY